MNKCPHGIEIIIKENYDKIYTDCRVCNQDYETHRAMERLMDKNPHNYQFCSNPDCNYIFSKHYDKCHRCDSLPEELSL